MAAQPEGDTPPPSGALPRPAGASPAGFGVYVHVPFCAARCGYCDFTTYAPGELAVRPGTDPSGYLDALERELALAARVLGDPPAARSLFVGGGTPSLLGGAGLARVLDAVRRHLPLEAGAEVTTEANPESVTPDLLEQARAAGFTRISLGMQSAVPHVLAVLDRRHTPGRALGAVEAARRAGFDHISLDLIYGTPGERAEDFAETLAAAAASPVDHVSAYALVVEDGTALARRVRRGELPAPDDDVLAERYEQADAALSAAGFEWYEVSNWARPGGQCRHNRLYWSDGDWWGAGPGAHSHVAGVRWWNTRHPATYFDRLADGLSPAAGRETVGDDARRLERVLLGIRLREGHPLSDLEPAGVAAAAGLARDGLLDADALAAGLLALTDRGRLLADLVVRQLV